MTLVVRRYRNALKNALEFLRSDPDMVLLAARNGLEAIKYALQEIQQEWAMLAELHILDAKQLHIYSQ